MDHKAKVQLLRRHKIICRRNSMIRQEWMRQRDDASTANTFARIFSGKRVPLVLPPEPEYEPYPDINGLTCGATTRAGTPCKLTQIYTNGRCKFHGGLSTGAKTRAGRKRQREGYRQWLEKQRASKAGRKRTRTYISDAPGIGAQTLADIHTSAASGELRPVHGMSLGLTDGKALAVSFPVGHTVSVQLATTTPQYGGVRWWYVCPDCNKRKTALYISDASLRCRQCAGLHYASQSKPTSPGRSHQ